MKRGMKQWSLLAVVAIAAVAALGLSGCVSGDDIIALGTIELNNNSVVTINGFYLAPVDQRSWGPNILSGPLFPGQRTFIVDIVPGYYDARVTASGQYSDYFGYLYDIPITEGAYLPRYVTNASFTGSLEIYNDTSAYFIVGVYVVPASAPTWGSNLLSSSIGPFNSRQIIDIEPGLHDVRIVWNVGPDTFRYGVRIESLTLLQLKVN
jgi:hypothetical protein